MDYTKTVIISHTKYISNKNALVDQDEYKETMINLERIKREALKFTEDYIAHATKVEPLHPSEYKRRYQFSSLKYFHKELGITSEHE